MSKCAFCDNSATTANVLYIDSVHKVRRMTVLVCDNCNVGIEHCGIVPQSIVENERFEHMETERDMPLICK